MSDVGREYRISQINMNGQRIVSSQLVEYCRDKAVDVLLLQDPPVEGSRIFGFEDRNYRKILRNGRDKATAAIVINPEIEVLENRVLMDRFIAVATLRWKGSRPLFFISAYFKYNVPITFFVDRLSNILERVGDRVLIVGSTLPPVVQLRPDPQW